MRRTSHSRANTSLSTWLEGANRLWREAFCPRKVSLGYSKTALATDGNGLAPRGESHFHPNRSFDRKRVKMFDVYRRLMISVIEIASTPYCRWLITGRLAGFWRLCCSPRKRQHSRVCNTQAGHRPVDHWNDRDAADREQNDQNSKQRGN